MPGINTTERTKSVALYALTSLGAALGAKLAQELPGDLFLSSRISGTYPEADTFGVLSTQVEANFRNYRGHIFIAASGLVIRIISPLLIAKDKDPAVVALDQQGNFAISLISGHLGDANKLASKAAQITGGIPVITTATDNMGIEAIDTLARKKDMQIFNLRAVKTLNSALLEKRGIQIYDPGDRLNWREAGWDCVSSVSSLEEIQPGKAAVIVDCYRVTPRDPERHLVLHPKSLVVGIGCNLGTSSEEIREHIREVFESNGLSTQSINCLSTTSKKEQETGLLQAAREMEKSLLFVPHEDLENIQVPNPSRTVQKNMGVDSICEAAALFQTQGKNLILPKTKCKNVTLAVAALS